MFLTLVFETVNENLILFKANWSLQDSVLQVVILKRVNDLRI